MPKFKVGDRIKNVHTGKLATIKLIHYISGFTVYFFEDGDRWNTNYESHWELA